MSVKTASKQPPLIVTGLSGAGMSSVLKALEDLGYEVFDNFPLTLMTPLIKETGDARIAIGVDTRARGFSTDAVMKMVKKHEASLLFLTCDDHVLQKRFTETRRRHPLAGSKSLTYGIKAEKELVEPLRNVADMSIDTTHMSIHDLRHVLEGHFAAAQKKSLTITMMSFGFRNGVPREADIVMDVRFLRNPHWEPKLKAKTGQSKAVGAYIEEDKDFAGFMKRFQALVKPLLPRYLKEGKSYLTIAVGCTGGKHRSVYVTEQMAAWLKDLGYAAHIDHRDMPINKT